MPGPLIGLLHVSDLRRYPWQPSALLESAGDVFGDEVQSFQRAEAPPVLIIVAEGDRPGSFPTGWAAQAGAVILLRGWGDDETLISDPELLSLACEDWAPRLGGLRLLRVEDHARVGAEELKAAVELARAHLRDHEDLDWSIRADPPRPQIELEGSAWHPVNPEGYGPRVANLGHDGRRAYMLDEGALVAVGDRAPRLEFGLDSWRTVILPGATHYLEQVSREQVRRRSLGDRSSTASRGGVRGAWVQLGCDPTTHLAFSGHRLLFYWLSRHDGGFSPLCAAAHDWPCGHAKKLWGYEDNDPDWICLSPRGDAYLSMFEHDAIVASSVPLNWSARGDLAVLDWPPADPLRALFFESSEMSEDLGAGDWLAEDSRARAPVVVLGASSSRRYAISLHAPTFRIMGAGDDAAATKLSDGGEGFAIYDARHQLVSRHPGRLLGGWYRFATVLEGRGRVYRVDVESGERVCLGLAGGRIESAVPIPGTRNVLVSTKTSVRVV